MKRPRSTRIDRDRTRPGDVVGFALRRSSSEVRSCPALPRAASAADLAEAEKLFAPAATTKPPNSPPNSSRKAPRTSPGGGWRSRRRRRGTIPRRPETSRRRPKTVRRRPAPRPRARRSIAASAAPGRRPPSLAEIEAIVRDADGPDPSPEGRVAPRAVLPPPRGRRPKQVLDQFYDAVDRAASPTSSRPTSPRPSWPSTSRTTPWRPRRSRRPRRRPPEDPRFHYLLARAFSEDDRGRPTKALAEALKINPRHVDSLLLQADHLIDAEKYADGRSGRSSAVLEVNPASPGPGPTGRCWPTCASDRERGGRAARDRPSRRWAGEPRGRSPDRPQAVAEVPLRRGGGVPAAGARRSTPTTCPPRCSSARTCCGSARRTEGWKLADEVFAADGYNVVAYNLVTLRDRLSKIPHARRTTASSCGWTRARRTSTARACWPC